MPLKNMNVYNTGLFSSDDHAQTPSIVLNSSRELGWKGGIVEHRYHTSGEFMYPPFTHHLISIHTGPAIQIEHRHERQTYNALVSRGNVAVIPAGNQSIWRHTEPAQFVNLQIDPSYATFLTRQTTDQSNQTVQLANTFSSYDPQTEQIGFLLLQELEAGATTGRLYAESLISALISHLVNRYAGVNTQSGKNKRYDTRPIQFTVEYIHHHLNFDISLATLADIAGLSPTYFIQQFRQATGLSPHQYIIKKRVEWAKQLIIRREYRITEIAILVGFCDQSHLARHMRRLLGVTPRSLLDS